MINAIQQYFARLTQAIGEGWNRFWFTPADPFTVSFLRVIAGVAAVAFVVSHTFGLTDWFASGGWLPVDTVQRVMETEPGEGAAYQWSYLNYIDSPGLLWAAHVAGIAIAVLFTLGLFTRITAVATLLVVLSYIHRAPMLAAQFEPVLATMIFYLCFTPCGRYLSVDRCLAMRKPGAELTTGKPDRSWSANVGLRLLQTHLSALYLMMAITKLGSTTWWEGGAMWWLMAQSQSRLVDLTFLRSNLFLINAWTHGVVLFELCFGLLIWNRLARPLLIGLSVVMWTLMALVTGLVGFCILITAGGAAFIPGSVLRSWFGADRDVDQNGGDASRRNPKGEAATAAA